ncbi:MAG: aquaporin [Candidatus Micrarchaeota archaeon]|nr:aquaporin [Candidatus Micrarchaeota archaeon]
MAVKSNEPTLANKAAVEMFGTFLLTFVGAGAIIVTAGSNLLLIAIAHGLALGVAVTIAMQISGGHINPAITLGMLAIRKISSGRALAYIIAQVVGAVIAGFVLLVTFPASFGAQVALGTPTLAGGFSAANGIALEAVMTFILMFTIMGTAVDKRGPKMGGLFIGAVLAGCILVGGPLTGAALNPARAIGPAIAGGYFANWYVYWIGPIIGAIVAALAYRYTVFDRSQR